MIRRALFAIGCACCLVSLVDAQAPGSRIGTIEVAGGGGLFGGGSLGQRDANLRANGTTPAPYRLFTTDSSFGRSLLLEGRVGMGISRRVAIEGRFGFSRPELRTSVSSDAEQGNATVAVERIDQYMIDGSGIIALERLRWRDVVPFAAAGAGYVRQVHEGQTLIESGHSYHIGGGVRRGLFTHPRGAVKAGGLRADARLYLLSGGVAFDTATRARVAVSGAMFFRF